MSTDHLAAYRRTIYFICFTAALGGLLFGLDQGFIGNALATVHQVYGIDKAQSQLYASVLSWGGIIGALISGIIMRQLGRQKALLIAGWLFVSMAFISAFIPPFWLLVLCRFGLGIAVGIAIFSVPIYLAETAPTHIRGRMTTLFQLMVTVGIFVVSVSNVSLSRYFGYNQSALTLMFVVIVAFALLMLIGSFTLPESPRWLLLKGKTDKAKRVLTKTRPPETDIDQTIQTINQQRDQESKGTHLLRRGFFWKVLLLGAAIQGFQQLVGINLMIYYAPTFFGYADITGVIAVLAIPAVNLLSTFPALKWVERWGRKKLLYFGSIVMGFMLLTAGICFQIINHFPNQATPFAHYFLVVSCVVYIFGFACSWGPVAFVLCSEIFPQKGREIGITVTTIMNLVFASVVIGSSLSIMEILGNSAIFYIFAGFCALSLLFLNRLVPETKDVPLETIENHLISGQKLRHIGQSRN